MSDPDDGIRLILAGCLLIALIGSWLLYRDLMDSRYRPRRAARHKGATLVILKPRQPEARQPEAPPTPKTTLPTSMELRDSIRADVAREARVDYIRRSRG